MKPRSRVASTILFALRKHSSVSAAAASERVKSYSEIPGPKPFPIIGNAWRFMPYISSWDTSDFVKWSKAMLDQYGKIVKISNLPGRKDMILVFDPVIIAEVFKNEGPFPVRFQFQGVRYYREKVRPDFYEGFQGIFNELGESWLKARLILNQAMMSVAVANLYVPRVDQVSKDFVQLVKVLRDEKMEMPENFKNEILKWTLESISLVAYDTRLGCLKQNLDKDSDAQIMIDSIVNIFQLIYIMDLKIPLWKFFPTKTLRDMIKHSDNMLKVSQKYVELASAKFDFDAPETSDMSVLQRILKRDPNTKRAVIMGMDILFGGVDTTSNTASSALYYLACNPDKQEKLYQQLKSIIPSDPNESITSEHLAQCKYLRACLKESMRLASVTNGTIRTLPEDVVLGNYFIPKGRAEIYLFNSTLNVLEEHFPEADKYIPERWLREGDSCPVRKASEAHPYTYLPFGRGLRQCPGMRFAYMEIETLIARMLLQFKLEWHYPPVKFISRALRTTISPLKFTILDRDNASPPIQPQK
ncbi:Hypothetical predicted protein [Cloeon dipterum]|uniref:Cytochrome P450 n=1 Tax=Cloeon dipterum TaxID=197152 RepID=A0A8S1C2V4_9INSE|nr:Hypothetical predicted protein [Cloeon dipterum]